MYLICYIKFNPTVFSGNPREIKLLPDLQLSVCVQRRPAVPVRTGSSGPGLHPAGQSGQILMQLCQCAPGAPDPVYS